MATRDQWMKILSRFLTSTVANEYYLVRGGTYGLELKGTGAFYRGDGQHVDPRSGTAADPLGITLETGDSEFLIVRHDDMLPADPMNPPPPPPGRTTSRDVVAWSSIEKIYARQVYKTPLQSAKSKPKRTSARKKA